MSNTTTTAPADTPTTIVQARHLLVADQIIHADGTVDTVTEVYSGPYPTSFDGPWENLPVTSIRVNGDLTWWRYDNDEVVTVAQQQEEI